MVAKAELTSMSGALCIWWDNQFISKLANDKMLILLWTRSLDDRQEFGFNPKCVLFSPYTLLNFFFFWEASKNWEINCTQKKIYISDFSWKTLNPGAIAPCGKICKNFRNNTSVGMQLFPPLPSLYRLIQNTQVSSPTKPQQYLDLLMRVLHRLKINFSIKSLWECTYTHTHHN